MLFVEVKVPVLEQVYDFKVEKKEKVNRVLFDMITKICQKENYNLEGKKDKVLLWDVEQKKILPKDWTMEECGIKTGTRLLIL